MENYVRSWRLVSSEYPKVSSDQVHLVFFFGGGGGWIWSFLPGYMIYGDYDKSYIKDYPHSPIHRWAIWAVFKTLVG